MTVPSFSVVIPAYNASGTIAEAVESVLGQTVRPLEVVVVDDGSTDDIEGALAPYRHDISLVRKEGGGGASALNAGLHAVSGDFVAQLDADDAYAPERLEALRELGARQADLDILATDAYLEAEGEVVGRFSTGTPFADHDQRVSIFDRCFMLLPAMRRERLLAIGGQDESMRLGVRLGLLPQAHPLRLTCGVRRCSPLSLSPGDHQPHRRSAGGSAGARHDARESNDQLGPATRGA